MKKVKFASQTSCLQRIPLFVEVLVKSLVLLAFFLVFGWNLFLIHRKMARQQNEKFVWGCLTFFGFRNAAKLSRIFSKGSYGLNHFYF